MIRIWLVVCGICTAIARPEAQQARALQRAGELAVLKTEPAACAFAPVDTALTILFDAPVDPGSVHALSLRVAGQVSGPVAGSHAFDLGSRRLVFQPARPFQAGERVRVSLSHEIRGIDRRHLRAAGYAFEFRAATRASAGTFTAAGDFPIDDTVAHVALFELAAGDFDGDRRPELVSANRNDLRTFMNLGGLPTTFDAPRLTGTSADPTYLEVEEVNGDAQLDLLLTDSSGLHVLLGFGDGFFLPVQTIGAGGPFRLLDLDGDAMPDLALRAIGGIRVYLNDGAGSFNPGALLPIAGSINDFAAGDMNGDGLVDLVLLTNSDFFAGDLARTYLADGQGSFVPAGLAAHLTGGVSLFFDLGDIDGDRDLDLCVGNLLSDTLGVLKNLGDGRFSSVRVLDFGNSSPNSCELGDLDGDMDLDWLVSNGSDPFGEHSWRAYRNDGSGGFTLLTEIASAEHALKARLLDLEGDGDLDFALADPESERILLRTND